MDTKFEKVLGSGRRVVVNLKRKHPELSAISPTGVKDVLSQSSCIKKGKLNSSNALKSGKRFLRYYSNYKKVGMLKRLMFYHNNEWIDFSPNVVALVNIDLVKKPAVEININGKKILLDFLHMMQVDLETGSHHPIAWIDISEKCFFPEVVGDYDEAPLETNDINLHLEIEIDELDAVTESSGESNPMVEKEISESSGKAPNAEAHQPKGNMNVTCVPRLVYMAPDVLCDVFQRATTGSSARIVDVRHCLSFSMEARWEIFWKQIEITKRHRGVVNLRYAWLPCSGMAISAIQKFGVGCCGPTRIRPVHGDGVHLIPANGTPLSVSYFDGDENDTLHMVLCRVIMGNMEFVRSRSNQFHPSSEEYDSGVDNLLTPRRYVVWTMNANSHIYPESVVSFKMTPNVEGGSVAGNNSVSEVSGISNCEEGPQAPKLPNSPWMSFALLLDAISGRISSDNMTILKRFFEMYKNKQITRDVLVKLLRMVIGDPLLKFAITTVRTKVPVK